MPRTNRHPLPSAARLLVLAALAAPLAGRSVAEPACPPSRVEAVRDTLHGVVVEDPYRWLEAKDAPETRAWIEAQNQYRDALLAHVPGIEGLREQFTRLLKVDAVGLPTERGGRYFFSRRRADRDQRVLIVRRGLAGRDEVVMDPHPLSADHTTSVSYLDVSQDGKLVAIGTRQGGADEVQVSFRDVDAGRDLADRLPRARYGNIAITADRRGVYYTRYLAEGPRVFFHALSADSGGDRLVFGAGYGPDKEMGAALSEEGRWLLITVSYGAAATRSELWVKDLATDGPVTPVVTDLDAYFTGDIVGDRLYLQTDWRAPRGRILRVDLRDPARERWAEVVPQDAGVIESFSLAGGRLFANELGDVVSKVRIFDPDGRPLGGIEFPTLGSVGGTKGRWASREAFFTFSSFVVPTTIFRYDVATGKRRVWWRPTVPIEGDRFVTKQVWYPSKDGTRVPMFLVHRKGLALDGTNPVFLTGYGGFDVNEKPAYSSQATLWVENGGVFALPNLRGGSEFGEDWHRAGMLDRKQNTFDDFIAAAEWLIRNRYTEPRRLAIEGGSNGGLLVGAALTQRPDLFRAVICAYPLLDMLRYQRFLVARLWVPEYGSAEDSAQFGILRAYSPYENVRPGVAYPAVLFVTGDSDTRVDPLHARKMTARLQAASASDRPVLLYYDTTAGHSGGRPVSKTIDDLAIENQFLFWQLGLPSPPPPRKTGRPAPPPSPIDSPVGNPSH
jgi:prolyl oligopeptidase